MTFASISKRLRGLAGEQGSAVLELALTLGIYGVPMLLGVSTLGQVVYASIEVANAAHAGALYGMVSATYAADTSGIRSAAQQEASDIGANLTVTPTVFYACSAAIAGTRYTTQSAATTACTGSGNHPLEFIQVVASTTSSPTTHAPLLPMTFALGNTSVMEVLE
jgi:Flp pilus assembly protein TadG